MDTEAQSGLPASNDRPGASDVFLRLLAGGAERGSMGIDLILSVGGMLVSGTLIGSSEYFQQLGIAMPVVHGSEIDHETSTRQAQQIQDMVENWYNSGTSEERKDQFSGRGLPVFIHLRNAQLFLVPGTPIPTQVGVLWRGRIEAVDGFVIGRIGVG